MNTLEQCLLQLVAEGLITRNEALNKAGNPRAIAVEAME
jgi:Tfp pilus assembly pilus retraction ATPase PilT